MDVATVGLRIASSAVVPLVRQVFPPQAPGAGLVDRPVRLTRLVGFGERGAAPDQGRLRKLTETLVGQAAEAAGPHDAPAESERLAVTEAVLSSIGALAQTGLDDIGAVALGPEGLADLIARPDQLPAAAEPFYRRLLETVCLHLVNHLTRRSTFVARAQVEALTRLRQVVRQMNLLAARIPEQSLVDRKFEDRYASHLVRRHGELTIHGVDLDESWPLDDAYLSLETTERTVGFAEHGGRQAVPAQPQRAEYALAGHRRVLLRGVAGSGKTTLVQWLAVTTAEQQLGEGMSQLLGRVPFVLPMRTLTRGGRGLPAPAEFLQAVGCPHTPPAGWVERVLLGGRGLLLIDGIDEVPEDEREPARRWLRQLAEEFPGNFWLVTARPSAVREDWLAREGFTDLTLSPMGREDIAAFVHRWHLAAKAGQEQAEDLLEALRRRPDLARLATNPLMCSLMCALHHSRHGYLPRGREALYAAALRMLLEQRDAERKVRTPLELDAETQVLLLQRLAYWLIQNGRSELERADAIALLDRALPSMPALADRCGADALYRHLLGRSGLLTEPADGAVQFIHRTFQDYLGAKEAIESRDIPLLVANAHLDQWEDVIRMAVAHGRREERDRLLKKLVQRGDKVKSHRVRLHLLAVACLEHAPQLSPEVHQLVTGRAAGYLPPRTQDEAKALAAAGPVVLDLLPGPKGLNWREAISVIQAAAAIGTDAASAALRPYRDHPDRRVRYNLAYAWENFDTDRYFEDVVRHLPTRTTAFWARNRRELALLTKLSGLRRVLISGGLDPRSVVDALGDRQLEELSFYTKALTDVEFAAELPGLRSLELGIQCNATDFRPLRQLRLEELRLHCRPFDTQGSPRGLRELSTLTHLGVTMVLPSLELLPPDAPLIELMLPEDPPELDGLARWSGLTGLDLGTCYRELTPAECRAIAGLPQLAELRVTSPVLRSLAEHGTTLPRVTRLQLRPRITDPRPSAALLAAIPKSLPGVRYIDLRKDAEDYAPLAALGDLRELGIWTPSDRVNVPEGVTVTDAPASRY